MTHEPTPGPRYVDPTAEGGPGPRRGHLVLAYAVLGAAWAAIARWGVPWLIVSGYEGRGLGLLNRFFRARSQHPVEHYLARWDVASGAILLAGGLYLALLLWSRRLDRRGTSPPDPRLGRAFGLVAMAFLGLTVVFGPWQDYISDLEMWDAVLGGRDPWWLIEGRGHPLNSYGPLFNLLAPLTLVNPLAPKLVFAASYLAFAIWLVKALAPTSGPLGSPGLRFVVTMANPLPWVEIAYFGHFDVLIAIACVMAVDARRRGRDARSGAWIAAGVLIKYLPIVVLPFLVLDGRRVRVRVLAWSTGLIALGMTASVLVWGPSTFRPLGFAATRGSGLLSVFRFLRGTYSPLRLAWAAPDIDALALPCLAAAGLALFLRRLSRRDDPARAALLAVSTTLLFYRVGYIQYQMVPFLLSIYWLATDGPRQSGRTRVVGAWAAYFGWLALFDLLYAWIGGVVYPDSRWAWVEELAGLPTFLLGAAFLLAVLANGPSPDGVHVSATPTPDRGTALPRP